MLIIVKHLLSIVGAFDNTGDALRVTLGWFLINQPFLCNCLVCLCLLGLIKPIMQKYLK